MTVALTTARVRVVAILAIASVLAVTTRSQPSTRLAPPVSRRVACISRGVARDLHVRHHRAVLLRQARHVEHRDALAFEVRRHAEDLADGDDAGAADAGDEDAVGRVERAGLPALATRNASSVATAEDLPLLQPPPSTVTKLGQKPFTQE